MANGAVWFSAAIESERFLEAFPTPADLGAEMMIQGDIDGKVFNEIQFGELGWPWRSGAPDEYSGEADYRIYSWGAVIFSQLDQYDSPELLGLVFYLFLNADIRVIICSVPHDQTLLSLAESILAQY